MTGHVYSAAYNDIAIDSQNGLVMYALTRETSVTDNLAGVWKTTDGGVNWNLVTREGWHENVIDEALSVPKCGDGVCGGRWETCDTCPVDCGPHTADCCGDGHRDPDETSDTCLADVPWDADPNVTLPYHEADYFLDKQNVHGKNPMNGPPTPFGAFLSPNGDFWGTTHALAIGNGTSGHNTLFFGNRRYKTIDAGVTWTAMDGTQFQGTGVDAGSMQAHGDATDTFVSSILTLSQDQLTGCGTAGCVFYGDHDNRLMVSSNGGASFEQEGWQWFNAAYPYACPVLPGIDGAITPTSIIAGPTGSVYVAAGVGFGADSVPYHSGVVKGIGPSNPALPLSGQTDLCKGRWTWTTPGTSLPWTNGAVDLFRRDSSSLLFATVYGSGVYKFNETSQTWYTLSINDQAPTGAKVTKIAGTTGTGARTFVAAGDTSYCDPDPITQLCTVPPASETGVWESCDDGSTWHKIAGLPGTLLESEPVTSLLPVGNNTLYVSTTFLFGGATVSNSVWSTNDGGVYKATYDPNSCDGNEWSGWSRVLAQPRVAAVGVSNNSSASLYAVANQICCSNLFSGVNAGVYKSDDSGATWNLLKNDGLMNLADRNPNLAQLKMSSIDPHKLYYGTVGSGLFEGLITCGTVAEGFTDWDGDGIADCSDTMLDAVQQITPLANGFIASGGLSNLYSTSANGTYEVLTENGSPKKLAKVWQFNVVTGRSYSLNVEAYKTDSASADDFKFSYAFQSTACTSSSAGGIALVALTVIKRGSDQDTVQTASLGSAGSNSVLCIRAADSKLTNDNQADSLTIDRIYLTLNSDAIASADQSIGPGTATGTYTNTQVSDSSREQLTETQVSVPGGNTSSLVQTWRFDLVPAGSSHKLHVQGYRPNNTEGDDFQFYYSFDNVNFFPISGAIINNATETTNAYIISETQGGTWYIRVQDTNSAAAQNPVLDSVYVNFLTIEAVP
jgi:hypothetical protein